MLIKSLSYLKGKKQIIKKDFWEPTIQCTYGLQKQYYQQNLAISCIEWQIWVFQ